VRLQELFGLASSPTVAAGRVNVLLHLLAPNHQVVQVTGDLASFWNTTYAQVRKDLRGRYPKHAWPEDPWTAPPTARAKRRAVSGSTAASAAPSRSLPRQCAWPTNFAAVSCARSEAAHSPSSASAWAMRPRSRC